jgi:tRNA(Ile)-lysidine synthetase-like protein
MSRWSESVDRKVVEVIESRGRRDGDGAVLEGCLNGDLDEWTLLQTFSEVHRMLGREEELTEDHLRACLDVLRGTENRRLHLPGSVQAEGSRGRIRFGPPEAETPVPEPEEIRPGKQAVCGGRVLRHGNVTGREALAAVRARRKGVGGHATEFFDAAGLEPPLFVRRWRPGDRLRPMGLDGSKLVSDVLTDAGLTGADRRHALVVEDGAGILWVAGVRRSDRAPVNEETREAAALTLEPQPGSTREAPRPETAPSPSCLAPGLKPRRR